MEEKKYIEDLPIADKLKCNYALTKEDVLSEEGLLLIQCMVRDGMLVGDIARAIGVKVQTFWAWRRDNKKLRDACIRGKQLVDYQVESALLKAALGYEYETVKVLTSVNPNKEGNRTVRVEKTKTEVGPSVNACLAWLYNRNPDQWKRNRDSIKELEDKESGITINIVKGKATKQEEEGDDNEDWGEDVL